jgi:hypothetical protein
VEVFLLKNEYYFLKKKDKFLVHEKYSRENNRPNAESLFIILFVLC